MKYFILLSLLLISNFSGATSITVNGSVSGLWTADTVIVQGNLLVPSGNELSISPGTIVRFNGYYRIDVNGSLKAIGTSHDSIIFSVRDTANFFDQSHGRGGWSGIRFRELSATEDSSIFEYCRFEFSKATEDSLNCYGGVILSVGFHKLRISNCHFYHNYSYYSGGSIYLENSDAVINRCHFKSNYSGNTGTIYGYGGGICSKNSSPVIRWNEFYANSSTGVGGAASFEYSDPVFEHNIMQHNFSALGGALGVLRSSPSNTFSNNLVANNEAMFFGGGVCCIRSFPVFSNFTISGNTSSYGGAFYCNDSAAPSIYNTIMWDNEGLGISVYIWDIFSAPNFYYCNIEGDTSGFEGSGGQEGYHGDYQNNINQDPEFAYTGMFTYQIWGTSPCRDAGTPDISFLNLPLTDLAGAPRVLNNRIDIGAYEYDGTTLVNQLSDNVYGLQAYPNPFNNTVTFILPRPVEFTSNLSIINLTGQIIKQIKVKDYDQQISWDGCDDKGNLVASGVYIVSINNSGNLYKVKIIK